MEIVIQTSQVVAQDWDFGLSVKQNNQTVALQEHNLQRLMAGVSVFVFSKADGTSRTAIGTLNPAFIPVEKSTESKRVHKPSPINQTFFDLQANEFRSYNMDKILALIDL